MKSLKTFLFFVSVLFSLEIYAMSTVMTLTISCLSLEIVVSASV